MQATNRLKQKVFPRSLEKNFLHGQDGMILVSALFIVAAASLIAVSLAGDTATDFRISGNRRVHQQNFYLADGGVNLGVQVARDFVLNRDEGLVEPADDYPSYGTFALNGDGTLYMRDFTMDADHVLDDMNGFTGSDNEVDGTDPSHPDYTPDIRFDLVATSSSTDPESTVTLDLDLLSRDAWGDVKFATGYDDPAGNKWVYYYNIQARATDVRRDEAHRRPQTEMATVYAVLK